MKIKTILIALILTITTGIALFLLIEVQELKDELGRIKEGSETSDKNLAEEHEHEEEYEIADVMLKFQRFSEKLWFAGINENWPLAGFYAHELEESMEELEEANVLEDDVNVSKLVEVMGMPYIEELEDAISKKDKAEFRNKYENMISGCNGCHSASDHIYVKIKIPETPAYTNQEYGLQ